MGITVSGGVKIPQGRFEVYVAPPPPPGKELWSWGRNSDGELGFDDTTNRSSPVQVGALTDWSSVSSGNFHSLALKSV